MHFVVIGSPRTGSSDLVHLLGSHPDTLCNGNVFHPQSVFVFWPKEALTAQARPELLQLRETDPDALLEHVFSVSFGCAHVGITIFQGQNDRILDRVIHDHDVRKIVLFRRSVLARYASVLAAKSCGGVAGDVSAATIKQHHVKQIPSDILSRFSNPGLARSFPRTRGLLHCCMRISRVSHRFPSPTKRRLKPTLHERDHSIGTFTRDGASCPTSRLT